MKRGVALAVVAVLALAGCRSDGGQAPPHGQHETRFLDRMNAAIGAVNAARGRLATDASAIDRAAQRIDDVDDVAVTGDRAAVRARRPAAAAAVTTAAPAAARYQKDVAAYATAITAVDAAKAEGLNAPQQRAVGDFVAAARAEVTELHVYAGVIGTVWPRYADLDDKQRTWLARASNGWYRDQQEAAGAYVVLSDRDTLAQARRSLATADAARLDAARDADRAANAARTALAGLLR